MTTEQKKWCWRLGVTIVGTVATFAAANSFPFVDDDNKSLANKMMQDLESNDAKPKDSDNDTSSAVA